MVSALRTIAGAGALTAGGFVCPLSAHAANGETLPDPNCTPGAISPKVTEDTLATTICRTGYTQVDPPAGLHYCSRKASQRSSIRLQRAAVGH